MQVLSRFAILAGVAVSSPAQRANLFRNSTRSVLARSLLSR